MFVDCSLHDNLPLSFAQSLFCDRGSQFVSRLGWDLCVTPEGMEIDEFDDDESTYIFVSDGRRHLGSCRVRPVTSGTMLCRYFRNEFPEAEDFLNEQRGEMYELTRFCRAPEMTPAQSREMIRYLAVGLDRFRDAHKVSGFVAVVFDSVARYLKRIGVRFLVLDKAILDGRPTLLICITHAIRPETLAPIYAEMEAQLESRPVGRAVPQPNQAWALAAAS